MNKERFKQIVLEIEPQLDCDHHFINDDYANQYHCTKCHMSLHNQLIMAQERLRKTRAEYDKMWLSIRKEARRW